MASSDPIARLLDANINRAREALRVLEDAARLALDDASLSGELKSLRHELRRAVEGLDPTWLAANRDIRGDVGALICAESETNRRDLHDVVTAAGKRLGEALRVIEETSKTIDSAMGRRVEAIRYRVYDVERSLQLRLGSGRARQWQVCVLLTESVCRRPWADVLQAAIDGGADCIQVREKSLEAAELCRRVERVVEVARAAGAAVIVNDRADVALAAGADGVHVGGGDLSVGAVRRLAGRRLLVGASTHDLAEAKNAVAAGADYCGVGRMFETATKKVELPPGHRGVDDLCEYLDRFPDTPHLAIGGITADNLGHLLEATGGRVRGVAVCAVVCQADRPEKVVKALRELLEKR